VAGSYAASLEIELARGVLAERGQGGDVKRLAANIDCAAVLHAQAPDDPGAVVAEEVAADRRGHGRAAIHVAARYRAVAFRMAVHVHRRHELAISKGGVRKARAPLEDLPAVVGKRRDRRARSEVDLFPAALADVTDVEIAVRTVEREAPGIAQAEPDDLPRRAAAERVDPQQLAQPLVHVLGAIARIAAGASVTHTNVEPPAGIELKLAAVVIRVGLADEQQLARSRLDPTSVARAELHDARIPTLVGVVHVETVVARVLGMEGHRQQTLLATADHAVTDVEERSAQLAVDEVADPSDLLDHVEAARLRLVRSDRRHRRKAARKRADRQLLPGLLRRGRDQRRGCEERSEHSLQITRERPRRIAS
jgi:hypothetical protein